MKRAISSGPTNILGLIPARGGSRGLPRKNLLPVCGRPLLAYTVEEALASRSLSRVVVSTEDHEIAEVARSLGAEVPFMRPEELARDETGALPVIRHAVSFLEESQGWAAQVIVYLQPTSPLRRRQHIDQAVDLLVSRGADCVVSVIEVPHQFNPVALMRLEGGFLVPFLPQGGEILRRQDKPLLYARNGPAVLACTHEAAMKGDALYGKRTLPLVMNPEDSVDVDSLFDLALVEWILKARGERNRE